MTSQTSRQRPAVDPAFAGTTSDVRRQGIALSVIATAQLMLVLDDSIVNIALPSIQRALGVAAVDLPWIVNAYILAFGALLLLGGRIGDLWGRRRTLQVGVTLFALASLVGGLGQSTGVLVAARAVQGVGAALTAPNALALIATTFADRVQQRAHGGHRTAGRGSAARLRRLRQGRRVRTSATRT